MTMTNTEASIIREAVARLECAPRADGGEREADTVRDALRGPARLYLETWVVAPLRYMLPESRNIELAAKLARPGGRPTTEPTRYALTMRSNTTHRTESEIITIHPGQDPEQEAARIAAGYGAVVDKLDPFNREAAALELLQRFAADASLNAADMVRMSREFCRDA
jgi:hypothetical protein